MAIGELRRRLAGLEALAATLPACRSRIDGMTSGERRKRILELVLIGAGLTRETAQASGREATRARLAETLGRLWVGTPSSAKVNETAEWLTGMAFAEPEAARRARLREERELMELRGR